VASAAGMLLWVGVICCGSAGWREVLACLGGLAAVAGAALRVATAGSGWPCRPLQTRTGRPISAPGASWRHLGGGAKGA
jgi:hypothetical protein